MRIIISDTSCLIDLRKAALLAAFLRLPFEILIPNTLFEDELLSFTAEEKRTLVKAGLKVVDLPGPQVSRARDVIRAQPRLSIHDGFAFALAETHLRLHPAHRRLRIADAGGTHSDRSTRRSLGL